MNLIVTQFADNELDTSDTVGNRAFLSNLLVRTASLTLRTTVVVWLVADCGLLSYQITQNYKRVVTLKLVQTRQLTIPRVKGWHFLTI